jgi:diaminohydroxyphosphoribosylaminopyrimidine deaminase/5-amino-6-(5-phosphoribosylamino)uracil reductase
MQRCLDLAARGLGQTLSNPLVGAVIVCDGEIIAEGWHQKFGEKHAERMAIDSILQDERLKKSTLYVNLEPCSHFGKTPPCADYILENGIPEVVYGMEDPFERVSGKGLDILRAKGVKVVGPILQKECMYLNRRFITFQTQKRPYIILKWAESADGFITSDSKTRVQISGHEAQILLHKWRSEEMAVLVGANTVVADRPQLNVRNWDGITRNRIFFDGNLRGDYKSGYGNTLVFNRIENFTDGDIEYIQCHSENFIPEMLKLLYNRQINSVLVEGGTHTIEKFLELQIWDEMRVIQSKKVLLENGIRAPKAMGLEHHHIDLGADMVYYYNR